MLWKNIRLKVVFSGGVERSFEIFEGSTASQELLDTHGRMCTAPTRVNLHTSYAPLGDCTRGTEQRTFVNKHETFDPRLFIIHTPFQLRSPIHRASSKRTSFEPLEDRGMDRVYDFYF